MEDGLTICVVGLGLMGGSLALALRRPEAEVAASPGLPARLRITAVARRRDTLEAARAASAIDGGTTDLAQGVSEADIVVLATPVRTILRLLPEVGAHARQGTLVLDLGSTKAEICAAMADLPAGLEPVGGHPMCGKEVAGFAAADANLYSGRPFVLCPLARTSPAAVDRAVALAEAIGARPILMGPAEQDQAVAAISHLPYVMAACLVNAMASASKPAHSLAASGFRDTSRLATSDVEMMVDILLTNREAILGRIDAFTGRLAELRAALANGDESGLTALLAAAQEQRRRISESARW